MTVRSTLHARTTDTRRDDRPAGGTRRGDSTRAAAVAAGGGILLIVPLAVFGNFIAVEGLVTEGDAVRTAANISASAGLFRAGIVSLLLVIALDVVAAVALYRVFAPVSRAVSMLSAALRLVFAGVFLVAIGELVGVLRLLGRDDYLAVFGEDQLQAQVLLRLNAFDDVWQAGLFLFGLHLLAAGYLAYVSGYVPRLIGALLAIAGLGYVADSVVAVLVDGSPFEVSTLTFVGEFVLAVWLVVRGRSLSAGDAATD